MLLFFFFNDTATTEIYTLSLHDALPISRLAVVLAGRLARRAGDHGRRAPARAPGRRHRRPPWPSARGLRGLRRAPGRPGHHGGRRPGQIGLDLLLRRALADPAGDSLPS